MSTTSLPAIAYDAQRMMEDMASKGWEVRDLARESGVSQRTAYRFLAGEVQTIRTGKLLARALGRSIRSYIVPSTELAASA